MAEVVPPIPQRPMKLWDDPSCEPCALIGPDRYWAERIIEADHYTRSVPAGKTHWFAYDEAIVAYSIPANPYLARFLLGYDGNVWELSRLWAPDGHRPNLLTQAIAATVQSLRAQEPGIDALVSFADPNVGHLGGVYRAASWIDAGQSEESRRYVSDDFTVLARRAFHSGSRALTKAEIEERGFKECRQLGKARFVRPLNRRARRAIATRFTEVSGG